MTYIITGRICGDKCLGGSYKIRDKSFCQCQDEKFSRMDGYYCCIPDNVTCSMNGWDVKCPKGKKLPWNTFCQEKGQCPIAKSNETYTALKSDCSFQENMHCPTSPFDVSKICSNDIQLEIKGYCRTENVCQRAIGVLDYKQCYNP